MGLNWAWIIDFCCWNWNCNRAVILEKQLTGHRVDRSICDWFWDHVISQGDSFKVPMLVFHLIFTVKAFQVVLVFVFEVSLIMFWQIVSCFYRHAALVELSLFSRYMFPMSVSCSFMLAWLIFIYQVFSVSWLIIAIQVDLDALWFCCLVLYVIFTCLLIVDASNCFTNTLHIPNRSSGDYLFSLHPSWNAAFDGYWGKCSNSMCFRIQNEMIYWLSMLDPWPLCTWYFSSFVGLLISSQITLVSWMKIWSRITLSLFTRYFMFCARHYFNCYSFPTYFKYILQM